MSLNALNINGPCLHVIISYISISSSLDLKCNELDLNMSAPPSDSINEDVVAESNVCLQPLPTHKDQPGCKDNE